MKKLFSIICLFMLAVFVIPQAKAEETPYRIYFYNSPNWGQVSAYIYINEGGNLVIPTPWPGMVATQDSEDSSWWYIEVTQTPPFNLIFNNGGSAQAGGQYITTPETQYTTIINDTTFTSKEDAEEAAAEFVVDPNAKTTLYFYNTDGWANVYLYVYGTINEDVMGAWPGTLAVREAEDSYWYSIEVSSATPFNAIFNNGTDAKKAESYIQNDEGIYLTILTDTTFTSKLTAEAAITEVLPIPAEDDPDASPFDEVDFEETIDLSNLLNDGITSLFIIIGSILSVMTIGLVVIYIIINKKLKI